MTNVLVTTTELQQICEEALTKVLKEAGIIGGGDTQRRDEIIWSDRKEAASLLRVSLPTLHSMINKGQIETRKVGPRRTLVNMTKLRADVASGRLGKYVHPAKTL